MSANTGSEWGRAGENLQREPDLWADQAKNQKARTVQDIYTTYMFLQMCTATSHLCKIELKELAMHRQF